MTTAFQQLLLRRKVFEGRVLPKEFQYDSPEIISVMEFRGAQKYGETFMVHMGSDAKKCLLKIPSQPLSQNHKYMENEIAKLESLAELNCPHIPHVYKSHLLGGGKQLPFYVTNYTSFIQEKYPSFKNKQPTAHINVMAVIYTLATTLKKIAEQDIVHCDICPQTVQFHNDTPILTHWGAAKTISELEQMPGKSVPFTRAPWLPPEVFVAESDTAKDKILINEKTISNKTDVWSLGLLFMHFLTGVSFIEYVCKEKSSEEETIQFLLETTHKNALKQYKNHCKQILEEHYLTSGNYLQSKFCDEIYRLCWNPDVKTGLQGLDEKLIFRFELDHIISTRDKLMVSREKEALVKEFYIGLLFKIFDMCVAIEKNRVTPAELVTALNALFPNIASECNSMSVNIMPLAPVVVTSDDRDRILTNRFKRRIPTESYIICPPFPPYKAEKGVPFTMGREADNRLILSAGDISRYHAKIEYEDGVFVLYDLGSANHCYVNDEQVEVRKLENGDKIRLGNTTFLHYQIVEIGHAPVVVKAHATLVNDAEEDLRKKVDTVRRLRKGIQGDLESMELAAVMQMLAGSDQTGCLLIRNQEEKADIYFLNGMVIHAEYGELRGKDAFWETFNIQKGHFGFDTTKHEVKDVTMSHSIDSLLLEVACFMDEQNRDQSG